MSRKLVQEEQHAMLDLRNVCKRFSGIPAVDDVTFRRTPER